MPYDTPGAGPAINPPRRFVVCGDNPLAYRLVDELVSQYDAHVTVILAAVHETWALKIRAVPGVEVIESDHLDEDAFRRARLEHAAALAIVNQDDGGNVDAALIAQESNPDIRIVIRMFNLRLGDRITQLLNNCSVISAAAIAAPAFVAAAMDESTTPAVKIADRMLVATPRSNARAEDILCGLAITGPDEPETLPAPADEGRADLVLAQVGRPGRPSRARQHRRAMHLLPILLGSRVRLALVALIALFAAATAVLAWVNDQMGWAQAAYVALLTELGGANADLRASGVERITLVVLTLVSIALIPALTAAVVDGVVKARLRLESGALNEAIEGHLVVVGLGDVGTRVVRALHEAGVEAVAIEQNPQARGVQVARDLGIPVIIGNASRLEVLQAASVQTSRALVVVSTNDVTNLETALLARSEKPDLRMVVRIFDGEFADRVQRAFAINVSRSVSYLAAPAFAAAMVGRQIIATIPVGRHVLLLAELPVNAGSALAGRPASSITRTHEVRLLGVRPGGRDEVVWQPSDTIQPGDRLVVVANRAGFSQLLDDSSARTEQAQTAHPLPAAPYPAHPRAAPPAEGPPPTPPFGQADAGSTQPA